MRKTSTICLVFLCFCMGLTACQHDAQQFDIKGIDVSHYQKKIDWSVVEEQSIDFVFIKATEGVSYQDSTFRSNWDALAQSDIKRGAYHFFRPRLSVEQQIKNFKQTVKLQAGDLPPVLDVEDIKGVSMTTLIERVGIWLIFIEEHYQVRPIVYTYYNLYQQHLKSAFPNHVFWMAHYTRQLPVQDGQWLFWQYSNREKVDGISTLVDGNVFVGSPKKLQALCLP